MKSTALLISTMATLLLSGLSGNEGFVPGQFLTGSNAIFIGETLEDMAGWSVASVGDVNGDGFGDFVIGAPFQSVSKGKTYLIFGDSLGWAGIDSLQNVQVSFIGEIEHELSGSSVASAGDVNGDGYDDIL
ncbi:integrin alpha, partial [Candidatus Neomarinimicrobiota bacterium]